jgi:lactoylglutathione lyase
LTAALSPPPAFHHSLNPPPFPVPPSTPSTQGLAFIKDPDGYLIEVLPQGNMVTKPMDHAGVAVEGGGYVDNSKK